jgi:1-deoxy-D-xylulose-5-phosphate synthase
VNMRWAKPLDLQTLSEMAQSHESLVTLEDGTRMGGAGSAVLEALQDMGVATQVLVMGFEDEFTEHGDAPLLMQQYGLTATGIQRKIAERWPVAHSSTTLRRVV